MSTSVIKQIITGNENGSQTIRMIVKSNERGPKGDKGDQGIQGPQGIPGPRGYDGVIQYRAGTGIRITDYNIIEATGGSTAEWGGIQGDIQSQTDLQQQFSEYAKTSAIEQEFGEYTKTANLATVATSGKYSDLSNTPTINNSTITITNNGETVDSFTTNASSAKTIDLSAPVITMQTTDPGEGVALASNNFIAVYAES